MRKILLSSAITLGVLSGASNISAYGGGGGFPPGYYDNPHHRPGLVCEWVTKELKNGHTVTVPRCKVVRHEHQRNHFKQRFNDFVERLRNGRR